MRECELQREKHSKHWEKEKERNWEAEMEKGAGDFSQGESSLEKNQHIVRNQSERGYIFLLTKLSTAKRGLREVGGRLAALISQSNKKKN